MKWVTRSRPKTDRIACPWLIHRFIDPEAEIIYVPTDRVLTVQDEEGAIGPGKSSTTATKSGAISALIRWSLVAIAVLLLIMLALRHPFVSQRLLIMVPTLLIISATRSG